MPPLVGKQEPQRAITAEFHYSLSQDSTFHSNKHRIVPLLLQLYLTAS
jgi:hypothetical protein